MLKDNLKIAVRTLIRRKGHTVINVFGLAVGLAVCLIIFIVIRFELSYDNYHSQKDRIYRVLTEFHHTDSPEPFYSSGVPYPLPAELLNQLPQLQEVAPIYSEGGAQIVTLDEKGQTRNKFKEDTGVFFTDPSLFNIFDFNWLAGNSDVLAEPNKVVLSRSTAEKYFGNWQNAIGRNIRWQDTENLEIAGIIADTPDNTDLQLKLAISYGTGYTAHFKSMDDWESVSSNFGCYVKLSSPEQAASVNSQIRAMATARSTEENHDSQLLQPLADVHFDTEVGNFSNRAISTEMINVLWLVAGFILLIACVNFINLATAQTTIRNKEIGVRKVLGGSKDQLRGQFLTETFIIVMCAEILAVVATSFSIGYIGSILDLPLSFQELFNTPVYVFLALVLILVTLLAGLYPAWVLSKFSPVEAFKIKMSALSPEGISLRRVLVVFQFAIAQILIIGTLILVNQMDYFMRMPLGFEKDAVLNLPIPTDSVSFAKLDFLRNELVAVNGINEVSFSSTPPTDSSNNWTDFVFDNATKNTDFYAIIKGIDHNYLPTYKLQLVAGGNFRPSSKDTDFLVNETVVKNLGFAEPNDVLNKKISLWGGQIAGTVIGVVKDFHERSFKEGIAPLLLINTNEWYSTAGIKFVPDNIPQVLTSLERIWDKVFPNHVFEYEFLDDKIANYYKQERRIGNLYKIAAAIAIILSCLGLYGLASFMILQRYKEAGIRKVLGATGHQLMFLFTGEFMLLIGLAFCIASPIAWYFMNRWLEGYEYHFQITPWIFLLGGSLAILTAMATISYETVKVAIANPVDSLRNE